MTQKVCGSVECAAEYARQIREKEERKELRARKEKLKTRSQWLKEAQIEFNRYIRERDRDLQCISCGRLHSGAYDAGHYRSVGAAPQLRFDEDNCHKQCVPCNQHKSGNAIEYRRGLVERIGLQRVAIIEANSETIRWTIEDAKRIKAEYKAKTAELIMNRKMAA
jgi:hypothetical protein